MIIFKYELQVGEQTLRLPVKRRVLTAQIQREMLCLWVMVDNKSPVESVVFHVVGTGQPLPWSFADLVYVATAQGDGAYVWHVFTEPQCGV